MAVTERFSNALGEPVLDRKPSYLLYFFIAKALDGGLPVEQ